MATIKVTKVTRSGLRLSMLVRSEDFLSASDKEDDQTTWFRYSENGYPRTCVIAETIDELSTLLDGGYM